MVEYMAHIKKPFSDIKTLVIGTVIGIIPIVSLLNTGFGLVSANNYLSGNKSLAEWKTDSIVDMLTKAIMSIIVSFVYLLPAMIVFGIVFGGSALSILGGGDVGAIYGTIAVLGLFGILGALLVFVGLLMIPMALMNMLKNGFGAAFSFGTVLKKVFTGKYIVTIIVSMVYMFVLAILFGVLSIIPIIGSLVGIGLMSFLGNATVMPMYAETYNEIQ